MKYLINHHLFNIKKMLDGQTEGGVKGVAAKKTCTIKAISD